MGGGKSSQRADDDDGELHDDGGGTVGEDQSAITCQMKLLQMFCSGLVRNKHFTASVRWEELKMWKAECGSVVTCLSYGEGLWQLSIRVDEL